MASRPALSLPRLASAALMALLLAPAAACASSGAGVSVAGDGVLSELPAHPAAGVCYARVKVLNDDRGPPPGPRAVWKETDALPGAMGPTWCLVSEPGYGPPPAPERFGWVKVLCDTDATPDRVRRIQSRLRAHGDYSGEDTGRYDQATADAVARFQQGEHIDHGGYLSLQTVEAIDRSEARRSALPPIHVTGCCRPPPPPERIPVPYPVRVEVKVPVPYPVEVRVPYEVRVPVRVEVPVPQPYPVRVEVPVPQPYPVRVPVRVEVPVPQPYPVRVPVPQPYPVYIPQPQPCCVAPPPMPVPQPCCQAPPPPPQPCCQGGGQGYPQGYGHDRDGWLSWPGKRTF